MDLHPSWGEIYMLQRAPVSWNREDKSGRKDETNQVPHVVSAASYSQQELFE